MKFGGAEKKPKKKFNKLYLLIPAGLFIAIIIFGFMPVTGSLQYGACRVFIEKQTTYPLYLDIISVQERPSDVRIEYTIVNEFGDTLFHAMICEFRPDPQTGFALNKVTLDRRKVEQGEIDTFNATLPAILGSTLERVMPAPVPATLEGLWRKPQYN